MQPLAAASIVAKRISRLAPEREYPGLATPRHGTRIELHRCLGQRVLNPLGIDALPGLESDILCVADPVGDRHFDDTRVGPLLPQEFAGLGVERTELASNLAHEVGEVGAKRRVRVHPPQ